MWVNLILREAEPTPQAWITITKKIPYSVDFYLKT